MPVAKILNLWNRTVGVVVMLLVSITGLILMTACHDIATYCAAQVSLLILHSPFGMGVPG